MQGLLNTEWDGLLYNILFWKYGQSLPDPHRGPLLPYTIRNPVYFIDGLFSFCNSIALRFVPDPPTSRMASPQSVRAPCRGECPAMKLVIFLMSHSDLNRFSPSTYTYSMTMIKPLKTNIV